jgi:transaldolase
MRGAFVFDPVAVDVLQVTSILTLFTDLSIDRKRSKGRKLGNRQNEQRDDGHHGAGTLLMSLVRQQERTIVKLFLDTANLEHIREACRWGIVDGATTNPTLVSKTGRAPGELYAEICRIVPGPVSLECMSTQVDALVAEAQQLAKIADNVVIKIPVIREGLMAVKQLAALGVKTNVTAVCSPLQALLAAKCGATFVSPFVGRWDAIGQVGMDMIRQMRTIYDNYRFTTQILVASARHPLHVLESALIGADACTIPMEVMEQLYYHPMTDLILQQFNNDWTKVPGK